MFALELLINGEKVVIAGIDDWDLIHSHITARRARDDEESDEFEVRVGGLAQPRVENQLEHVRWGNKSLKVGDEVTIRLVDVPAADVPIKRYRSDREVQENPFTDEEIHDIQKRDYLRLKKIFEGNSDG